MKLAASLLALALVGCSDKPKPTSMPDVKEPAVTVVLKEPDYACPNEEAISILAMRKIDTNLGELSYEPSVKALDAYDRKLECLDQWADTLPRSCIKPQYQAWIRYYRSIAKTRREDINSNRPAEEDLRMAKFRENEELGKAWERTHKIPLPPKECQRIR